MDTINSTTIIRNSTQVDEQLVKTNELFQRDILEEDKVITPDAKFRRHESFTKTSKLLHKGSELLARVNGTYDEL